MVRISYAAIASVSDENSGHAAPALRACTLALRAHAIFAGTEQTGRAGVVRWQQPGSATATTCQLSTYTAFHLPTGVTTTRWRRLRLACHPTTLYRLSHCTLPAEA